MILHSVLISYNRLELTKRALESYLETVSVPFSLTCVDNKSEDGSPKWLTENFPFGVWGHNEDGSQRCYVVTLTENKYPGYACNEGFHLAPSTATHLHRMDNDFVFLPGWCEELAKAFTDPRIGQVGLRTNQEELYAKNNVGGNMAIRRELWDKGLRYDERPWPELPKGYSEDSFLSPAVRQMGYMWRRVRKPCIVPISPEHTTDPYYLKSWADRGIVPPA